jgi:nucleotide-binding universal stress UspA family protein
VAGVDESEGAAAALRWAKHEADLRGRPLTAVLAWGYLDQHVPWPGESIDPSYSAANAEASLDATLERVLGTDRASGIRRLVVCDLSALALLQASEGAALLVVGARGLGGFRGLLLGSVSQHCLRHARCPVAIVHGSGESADPSNERIVVGVDGSDESRDALRWALDEARARGAEVEVVHAWTIPYVGMYGMNPAPMDRVPYESAAREALAASMEGQDTSGLRAPVATTLVFGSAGGAVLERAEGAALVVLGSRGLGGFRGLLLGSVSSHVANHATCPVVVVRSLEEPSGRYSEAASSNAR